jgi:hypothetical protein
MQMANVWYLHDKSTTVLLSRFARGLKRAVAQPPQPLRGAARRSPRDVSTQLLQERSGPVVERRFETNLRRHQLIVDPRLC